MPEEAQAQAQAQALVELPASITPLVRRHVEDAAFYWKQLRIADAPPDDDPSAPAEPHLSPAKRAAFEHLLSAHLDGIREAGADAWPLALEALQRWRKASETYAAGWAVLSAAMSNARSAQPSSGLPELDQPAPVQSAWQDLWLALRTQRANWATLLPALHDAWQAATLGPDAWPGAATPLQAALETLSPALQATPLAPWSSAPSSSADAQRLAWCAALEAALSTS
jgi:hypothetical protein